MTKRVIKTYIEHCNICLHELVVLAKTDKEAIEFLKKAGWTYAVTRLETMGLICNICSSNRS